MEKNIADNRDGIVTFSKEGFVMGFNSGAEQIFGFLADEIIGQPMINLLDSPRAHLLKNGKPVSIGNSSLKDVLDNEIECLGRRKDGSTFPLAMTISSASNSDKKGADVFTGLLKDIGDRKKNEAQTRLQSAALEVAANAIVITDEKGIIEWVNPAFTKMTGYSDDDVLGKNTRIFKSGEHGKEMYEELWNTVLAGKVWKGELTNRRKDGAVYLEEMTITPMLNDAGKVSHFIAVKQDVTERKDKETEIEEQRKALEVVNQDLAANEKALRVMFKDLKKTHEKLLQTQNQLFQSEKLKVVGRLASGVAHEVKNPLAIILQGVEYVSRKVPQDNENIKAVLNDIDNAVHRADSVIRGLLDFSSISHLEKTSNNVNDAVESSLLLVKHEFQQSKIEVVKNLKKDLPNVEFDKNKIEQVLVNLMLNSIHAMQGEGGGTLTIETRKGKILQKGYGVGRRKEDPFRIGDDVVIMEVLDTGPGIPEENLTKIFEPFFTTKQGKDETGLGLSIIENIIDFHKEIFDLANREEGGVKATITFKIPEGGEADVKKENSSR